MMKDKENRKSSTILYNSYKSEVVGHPIKIHRMKAVKAGKINDERSPALHLHFFS